MMTRVSQLWDLIETWGFCEDIKDIDADVNDANDKEGNDDKGISALGLDRVFSFMTIRICFINLIIREKVIFWN